MMNWLVLVGVFAVALASPGPDFVMSVRNSVMYSRRAGIMTAIGFALGVGIHVAYCMAGIAIIIAQSVLLFNLLKFAGAGYLFYVGYKALRSKGFSADESAYTGDRHMTNWDALRSGFITNLFNPKATMLFLALFTQVIDPNVSHGVQFFIRHDVCPDDGRLVFYRRDSVDDAKNTCAIFKNVAMDR